MRMKETKKNAAPGPSIRQGQYRGSWVDTRLMPYAYSSTGHATRGLLPVQDTRHTASAQRVHTRQFMECKIPNCRNQPPFPALACGISVLRNRTLVLEFDFA
eukprot:3270628-Rhodomonas_salina.1